MFSVRASDLNVARMWRLCRVQQRISAAANCALALFNAVLAVAFDSIWSYLINGATALVVLVFAYAILRMGVKSNLLHNNIKQRLRKIQANLHP